MGSHLCDALLGRAERLVVVDSLVLGRVENISHLVDRPDFRFVKADILASGVLEELFEEEHFDDVYHLAANSDIRKGSRNAAVDRDLTFETTFRVLQTMQAYGTQNLIFTSSSAIYGEHSSPLAEDSGPLTPVSMYGAAKLASEAFISAFAQTQGLRCWVVRFPNVVGERATHGVLFDFIKRLREDPSRLVVLGNGLQSKPYIYVRDLVDAILWIRDKASETINTYNVGVSSLTDVRSIAQMVTECMGLRPEIVFTGGDRGWLGDVPTYRYDCTKLRELGWQAPRNSDESVRMAISRILETTA